ncbi:Pro-Pol polyprotein [Cucumispora dikerogammari]|nr:Pro-Pol polyprotein [Cucumispora dikerogammari]
MVLLKYCFSKVKLQKKTALLVAEHEKAHFKTEKIFERLNNIAIKITRNEVKTVIDACANCQIQNKMKTYNSIQPIIAKHAFHRYKMDLMSLIAYSDVNNNYKYILVVIDCYSKFIWAFPLTTKSPAHVKTSIIQIFNTFAPPKILQFDNGKEFKNSTLNDLCEECNIVFLHGRHCKLTTQNQDDRSNSTIKTRF